MKGKYPSFLLIVKFGMLPREKSHFSEDGNQLKSVFYKNNVYVREKIVNKKREYKEIDSRPVIIVILNRYRTVLKRWPSYRSRITWIENDRNCVALVEYIGPI